MASNITVYSSTGLKDQILKKIARSCGFRYRTVDDFRSKGLEGEIIISIGILGVGGAAIREAQRLGKTFIYLDYAYFKEVRKARWWRVHVNSFHAKSFYDYGLGPKRAWRKYDRLTVKPPRQYTKSGDHILVCPPTPAVAEYFNQHDWLEKTVTELEKYTNRPIRIRHKPSAVGVSWDNDMLFNNGQNVNHPGNSIDEDFRNCWAMVTYNSAMFVDALQRGVPVFSGDACAAHLLGNTDLASIEYPRYPNVMPLFWSLAEQQFTPSELMQSETWKYILRQAGL